MSRHHDRIGKTMRGIAYACGAGVFAALTHRFDAGAAVDLGTACGVLAAAFGFLPRAVANAQRAQMRQLVEECFAELRAELGDDINLALRHAVELGVHDGALRRGLDRRAGEPPRPRRLHAVRQNREGA
jgi:hypothetical protein